MVKSVIGVTSPPPIDINEIEEGSDSDTELQAGNDSTAIEIEDESVEGGNEDSVKGKEKHSDVWEHFNTYETTKNVEIKDWMDERGDEMVKEHEVDKYLNDPFKKYIRGVELEILCWWKLNGHIYPVLAAIAKDVLSIQVSTVASESSFSTGGRIVDSKRSSLTPRSVQKY